MDTLEITKKKENDKLIVSAAGRIDTVTSPEFEAQVKADIDGVSTLVFDFEKLNYISSSGLRVILGMHKTMIAKGGSLIVSKPTDIVTEVFEVTGFSDILDIRN